MSERPTYLSLFSGIGGLDLAVEALGFRCVGQVEWDESCRRVLERWWPAVPRWGDVREFTAASYAERHGRDIGSRSTNPRRTLDTRGAAQGEESETRGATETPSPSYPHAASYADTSRLASGQSSADWQASGNDRRCPDLICGGFPCQPVSTAGKRKGTADERWLWPEFARVVGELRPRYVFVENTPGLLTVNGGRAFSEVLGDLASLGYDARWTSLRASDVGACHRRERIFLLAERADADGIGLERTSEREGSRRTEQPRQVRDEPQRIARDVGAVTAAPDSENDGRPGEGQARGGRTRPSGFPWGSYEPAVRRHEQAFGRRAPRPVDEKGRLSPVFVEWMMGLPEGWTEGMTRTQALKALGNAVVPQQGAAALDAITQEEERK